MENLSLAVSVVPQLTSLNRVVLDLIDLYQPAFARKRLGSGLDLDPGLPLTWIDAPQLERGLAGLLRNAVKHSHNGDLVVCRTAAEGGWVELTIGDSGAARHDDEGADPAAAAGEGGDGNGLGFEASQAIIAAHGGEITVERRPGAGARFVVRLPVIALENARLIAALERGNRLKYELLATLSYELRTPLNVIFGYNDLLMDGVFGPVSPEQHDILRRVEEGTHELLDLVNLTLDPSRHLRSATKRPSSAALSSTDGTELLTAARVELASLALENAWLVEELEHTKRVESEFITSMSHQLRVPLNGVLGYTDLLLDGEFGSLAAEQTTVLRRMRKAALDLLSAINSNLDFRHLEG